MSRITWTVKLANKFGEEEFTSRQAANAFGASVNQMQKCMSGLKRKGKVKVIAVNGLEHTYVVAPEELSKQGKKLRQKNPDSLPIIPKGVKKKPIRRRGNAKVVELKEPLEYTDDNIRSYYTTERCSIGELAEIFNVSPYSLRMRMRKLKLKSRKRHEQVDINIQRDHIYTYPESLYLKDKYSRASGASKGKTSAPEKGLMDRFRDDEIIEAVQNLLGGKWKPWLAARCREVMRDLIKKAAKGL